jgi:hypothetical protein
MEFFLQGLAGLDIFHFGEDKEIGSAKMSQRFSQNASWEEVMVSETDMGIDEQNIKISMELKMLITIVQQ